MMKKPNRASIYTTAHMNRRYFPKWITLLIMTSVLAISGCETLSICTFPSDKRATSSVLPTGRFIKLNPNQGGDESIQIAVDKMGYRVGTENRTEYLELFELDGYLGFGSRNALPTQSEMESVPEMQRKMINDAFETGLHPWRFGAIEVYGDAILMLIPSLLLDEVHEYIELNKIQLINGGISDSAAQQIIANEKLAQEKKNAGPLQQRLGLYDASSTENAILMVSPDQLELITSELLQRDLLMPFVLFPEAAYNTLQGVEDNQLDAIRQLNPPLADRYEYIMNAFQAREDLDDED